MELNEPGLAQWHDAARLLLNAVGCQEDSNAATSLPELAKLLRGSGYHLQRVALLGQTLADQEGQLGCLLEMDSGEWRALLGNRGNYQTLRQPAGHSGAADSMERPASAVSAPDPDGPWTGVRSVWVLRERLLDLRNIAPFFQRYRSQLTDLLLAALVVNLFGLVLPLFSSFVYDKVLANGILETLWALVIGVLLLVAVEFAVRVLRTHIAERFAVGSEVEIDNTFFHNLVHTKANKMPGMGLLLEKYKQIVAYRDFLSSSYILALADLPFLLLFLVTITLVSGPLVLVSVVCGGLMLLSNWLLTPPLLHYERAARVASEKRLGLMNDLLSSREAVIGSALRQRLFARWRQASVSSVQSGSQARYWRGVGQAVTTSISYISFVAVLVGGVYMVEDHSLTSGGLLAASMLTSRTMGSLASVITLLLRYREFRNALTELNQILPEAGRDAATAPSHGQLLGAVRLDEVSCQLRDGDKPVLSHINLRINPGEIVGIAGAPGCGKTTLLRLITGLISPTAGRILVDGIPVEELSADDISANFGFKPQDFSLLDGTIEDNVRAGRPALGLQERQRVLQQSGLARAFDEASLHWETEIGARGMFLSGGQRQLVSLARAMLTQPPLLLLDEPTNGLDEPLEKNLAQQLLALRGKSTILISSHSRSMLSICDRIIVIGQSRILADGPREKILA